MSRSVPIDGMADAIMDELNKYAEVAADDLKDAVKDTAKLVRKDIQATAPVRTVAYAKSWSVKNVERW